MLQAYRDHIAARAKEGVPPKPLEAQQVVGNLPDQCMSLLWMGHHGQHKFSGSHQVGSDVERPPRNGETDLMSGLLHAGLA